MSLISKRAQQFKTSGIRKIFDMAMSLKKPINFSIGQPDFGVSERVKQKTIEAINNNLSQYTPTSGIEPLRIKVSRKLEKDNNIKKDPSNILIIPGTSAGIFLALSTLIDTGDEVIIADPYFVEYPELVKFLGGKSIFLDTYPDFQINPEKLKNLITKKTKAIIINSPNNPTGVVYPEKILREIAEILKNTNITVISDEIYEKFVYDNARHFSIGSVYENTVTVGGLSKSGGMPGWRLAWATGPKEVIEKMKELQQYTFVCAPSLVQYGALASFEDDLSSKILEYQEKRDLIFEGLSKKFKVIKPQGAFYIMPDVGSGEEFTKLAIKRNVLIIPGGAFSKRDTHIRVSYATSNENIKKGLEILFDIVKTSL